MCRFPMKAFEGNRRVEPKTTLADTFYFTVKRTCGPLLYFQGCFKGLSSVWDVLSGLMWGSTSTQFCGRADGPVQPDSTAHVPLYSLCLCWTQSQVPGLPVSRLVFDNLSAWNSENTSTETVSFQSSWPFPSNSHSCIRKEGSW